MKKILSLIPFLFAINALAVDKLQYVDPTKPNYPRVSSITITNGGVVTSTNNFLPASIIGITSSAGAADANKIPKTGPLGTLDVTIVGGTATSNQVLVAVSPSNATWQAVTSAPFTRMYLMDASGNFTNSFGVTQILAEGWGGGGGGGGYTAGNMAAGGGGGGGYFRGVLTVTNGQILAVVVGAAGTRGSSGGSQDGSAGGDSTISNGTSTFTATGGTGGTAAGAGGDGSGGSVATEIVTGSDGGAGEDSAISSSGSGGAAGKGGGGGKGAAVSGTAGSDGNTPGGGGGGGLAANGGHGAVGRVIVWY